MKKDCFNCRHNNLKDSWEPCCDCQFANKWEPIKPPKTCDGCKYSNFRYSTACIGCVRYPNKQDNYQKE